MMRKDMSPMVLENILSLMCQEVIRYNAFIFKIKFG